MKRKGLILAVLAAIVAAVTGLAACNGEGNAPAKYTVTFETNGGSAVEAVTVDKGGSVNLPAPTMPDHTFDGWFDNTNLDGSKLSTPYFPTANVTLYAKWEESDIIDGFTNNKYFTFEDIKGDNDSTIGYSAALAAGKVPAKIIVPNSYNDLPVLTIKDFTNESITETVIPDSVTEIENGAFSGCENLEKITLLFVGRYADATKGGATHFGFVFGASSYSDNSTAVPAKLKTVVVTGGTIRASAFYFCSGLTSVTIGSGVKSIGNGAFYNCSGLTSITVPDSVTSIGSSAFYNCSKLTSVIWNATDCTTAGSYEYPIFSGCTSLTSVEFGDGVKTIPAYAFYDCSGLTSVTIPDSVKSIGSYAFNNRSGLTSVTIGSGVTNIGDYAFEDCSGLTSVTIGSDVKSIYNSAFSGCSNLTSITFNGTTAQWKAIIKGTGWAINTPSFTVTCTDGTLTKSEALA